MFKYVHVTDQQRKADRIGNPLGRVTHKIALLNPDGSNRSASDIANEIAGIKRKQKEINIAYKSTHLSDRGTNIVAPPNPAFSGLDVRYDPLILQLDPGTGNTCAIFGSSKRGKTTALMEIYNKYYQNAADRPIVFLFAKNPQISSYNVGGDIIKLGEYRDDIIKAQHKINRYSSNKFSFCNLIDDFIDIKNSKELNDLILTLRNSMMSTVICLQYVNTLSKAARSNVNNVLLFGQNTDEAAEQCINVYLRSWMRKKNIPEADQISYFHKITSDHSFIHIHPQSQTVHLCRLAM